MLLLLCMCAETGEFALCFADKSFKKGGSLWVVYPAACGMRSQAYRTSTTAALA